MCKHAFFRISALVMALLLLMLTPAFAASCTLCGSETGSDDYLCTNCLLALLAQKKEAAPMEVSSCAQNPDGTVTIAWSDAEGNGPYTVTYALLDPAPVAFAWVGAEGLTDTTHTLTRLVPGVSYVITIHDSKGQQIEHIWYAQNPAADPEIVADTKIGAKIQMTPILRSTKANNEVTGFSLAEITGESTNLHGLRVQLTYSTLIRARNFAFQLVVEAPNGFGEVVYNGALNLSHGKSTIPAWNFISLDEYFSLLQNYYGSIPTGEYTVTICFRGMRINTATFTVGE